MEQETLTAPADISFRLICRKNGLNLSDEQTSLLAQYASLLVDWNQKINLISRKDEHQLWQSHLLHSISPLFKLRLPSGLRILDLGTGGGLPGIPWSIVMPDSAFLLMDATQKKIAADASMIDAMKLGNVRTIWGRAEELAKQPELAGCFDLVTARAVAPLKDLIVWAKPFLRNSDVEEGEASYGSGTRSLRYPCLVALKGGDIEEEIRAVQLKKLAKDVEVVNLVFEGSEGLSLVDKKLVIVEF